jgi:hypothetical protein
VTERLSLARLVDEVRRARDTRSVGGRLACVLAACSTCSARRGEPCVSEAVRDGTLRTSNVVHADRARMAAAALEGAP